MGKIRLLLIDDSTSYRNAISSAISTQPDMEVVGEGSNGLDAVKKALELMPSIVLMDVAMPQNSGIEATQQLKHLQPNIKVIGLSVHDEEEYVSSMMEAGASAYVLKESPLAELLSTIRDIF